jgi:hypothetical protein
MRKRLPPPDPPFVELSFYAPDRPESELMAAVLDCLAGRGAVSNGWGFAHLVEDGPEPFAGPTDVEQVEIQVGTTATSTLRVRSRETPPWTTLGRLLRAYPSSDRQAGSLSSPSTRSAAPALITPDFCERPCTLMNVGVELRGIGSWLREARNISDLGLSGLRKGVTAGVTQPHC